MRRPRTAQMLAVALLVIVLAAASPTAARTPAQTGDWTSFDKPEWGLSLQYPAGWQVGQQDDYVTIGTVATNGGMISDAATLTVVRRPEYADPNVTLEEILLDACVRLDSPMDNVTVEESEAVEIDGHEGRAASFDGTDRASGLALTGGVIQLTVGTAASPWRVRRWPRRGTLTRTSSTRCWAASGWANRAPAPRRRTRSPALRP